MGSIKSVSNVLSPSLSLCSPILDLPLENSQTQPLLSSGNEEPLCLGTPHRCTLSEREVTACWEVGVPSSPFWQKMLTQTLHTPIVLFHFMASDGQEDKPQRIPAPTWQTLKTHSKSCPRWNIPTCSNLDHDHFSASFPCLTTWTNSHLKTCPELLEGTRSPPPLWFWTLVEFWLPPQADLLWDFNRSVCVCVCVCWRGSSTLQQTLLRYLMFISLKIHSSMRWVRLLFLFRDEETEEIFPRKLPKIMVLGNAVARLWLLSHCSSASLPSMHFSDWEDNDHVRWQVTNEWPALVYMVISCSFSAVSVSCLTCSVTFQPSLKNCDGSLLLLILGSCSSHE